MIKNSPANAGDPRDVGSIPGSERSLEQEMATYSSILSWKIPWIESMGSQSCTRLSTGQIITLFTSEGHH